MASARNFTFFFLFLQKRDFLYRYWGDIHRRFFSFLQLSPSKQGESFLVLMTPMGLCGRNKSSKNVKKTRGVLSWHPLVAAPNDTEGHGVWKSQKKSHFNIASEASYVYKNFIKNDKNGQFLKVLKNLKLVLSFSLMFLTKKRHPAESWYIQVWTSIDI